MHTVFEYSNYRDFIKDYCIYKKAISKHFSNRSFAIQAGFNSSGFLTEVIKGKRNLSDNYIGKFITGMKLTGNEAEYFKLLVKLNQTDLTAERQIFYKQMVQFMPINIRHLKEDHQEYFKRWHHSAIREFLAIRKITDNYQDIVKSFITPFSIDEVKESIELLHRLGLIKRLDENRRWVVTNNSLWSDENDVTPELINNFKKQVIIKGLEIAEVIPSDQRKSTTTTMSISKDSLEIIKKKINDFHREIVEIVEVDTNETDVYQLNIQFFPYTK